MAETYFNDDTISAIATSPHAQAPIGVIRVSGPKALSITLNSLRSHHNRAPLDVAKIQTHKLQRCLVVDHENQILDDAMFVWMQGPNSFTGEDVVELHLHGNPQTLRRVLGVLISGGSRIAHPGEFSFRAFRNGKMDLSQAEAVMDVIASRSIVGVDNALQSLLGSTRSVVDRLKAEIVHLLAEVEVDIDFSDQGLSQIDFVRWSARLVVWCEEVEKIRKKFKNSAPLREGIRVAIVGAPNSGKSTLFNALLGEDRSIVSDVAGTTRDVVRESFLLAGLLFLLSDTAGIRKTEDKVESAGITRSYGELRGSQLIFWVIDSTDLNQLSILSLEQQLSELRSQNASAPILLLLNKSDLVDLSSSKQFTALGLPFARISALSGSGVMELEALVLEEARKLSDLDREAFPIGRMRHYELLGRAAQSVRDAIARARSDEPLPDLLSSDMRTALSALGEITGEVGLDDVLNHIFSEFCIGK